MNIVLSLLCAFLISASAVANIDAEMTAEDQLALLADQKTLSRIPLEFRNPIVLNDNMAKEVELHCLMTKSKAAASSCQDLSAFQKAYHFDPTSLGFIGRYEDLKEAICLNMQIAENIQDSSFLEELLLLQNLDPHFLDYLMSEVIKGKITSPSLIARIISHPNYHEDLLYRHIISLQKFQGPDDAFLAVIGSLLKAGSLQTSPKLFTNLLLKYSQASEKVTDSQKLTALRKIWELSSLVQPMDLLNELNFIKTPNIQDSLASEIFAKANIAQKFESILVMNEMEISDDTRVAIFEKTEPFANTKDQAQILINFLNSSRNKKVIFPEHNVKDLIQKAEAFAAKDSRLYSSLVEALVLGILPKRNELSLVVKLLEVGTMDEKNAYALSDKVRRLQSGGLIASSSEESVLNGLQKLPQSDAINSNIFNIFLSSNQSQIRDQFLLQYANRPNLSLSEFQSLLSHSLKDISGTNLRLLRKLILSDNLDGESKSRIVLQLRMRRVSGDITDEELSFAKELSMNPKFDSLRSDLKNAIDPKPTYETVKPLTF